MSSPDLSAFVCSDLRQRARSRSRDRSQPRANVFREVVSQYVLVKPKLEPDETIGECSRCGQSLLWIVLRQGFFSHLQCGWCDKPTHIEISHYAMSVKLHDSGVPNAITEAGA